MFSFSVTCRPSGERTSAFALITSDLQDTPQVGTYDSGIISVVDTHLGESLLRSWDWLVPRESKAIVTTAFGDLFLWQPHVGISFLEVQRGEVTFVDSEAQWFLDEFLLDSRVQDDVLRRPRFEQLKERLRGLEYLEAFILEPWQILGGEDSLGQYTIGSCSVYLDLVGQALCRGRM